MAATDFDATRAWYERLPARPADNLPMEGLAEWQVTETGWVQVFCDAGRPAAGVLAYRGQLHDRSPGHKHTPRSHETTTGAQRGRVAAPRISAVTTIRPRRAHHGGSRPARVQP